MQGWRSYVRKHLLSTNVKQLRIPELLLQVGCLISTITQMCVRFVLLLFESTTLLNSSSMRNLESYSFVSYENEVLP